MATDHILVLSGSLAFLCLWVAAFGLLATGSGRAAWQYLRLWLLAMGGMLAVGAVLTLAGWVVFM